MALLSVPGDSVHGFQPVTNKHDIAICIIWKTGIDIYSLSLTRFTALLYPEQQSVILGGQIKNVNCVTIVTEV